MGKRIALFALLALSPSLRADDWTGTTLKFQDAAARKKYMDVAAKCKGDATCFEAAIIAEAKTAGELTAAAFGGLPDVTIQPLAASCRLGSELKTIECIGKVSLPSDNRYSIRHASRAFRSALGM